MRILGFYAGIDWALICVVVFGAGDVVMGGLRIAIQDPSLSCLKRTRFNSLGLHVAFRDFIAEPGCRLNARWLCLVVLTLMHGSIVNTGWLLLNVFSLFCGRLTMG